MSESFHKCKEILISRGFIADIPNDSFSDMAVQMGNEMTETLIDFVNNLKFVEEDELISF